jgi:hypothetical protein
MTCSALFTALFGVVFTALFRVLLLLEESRARARARCSGAAAEQQRPLVRAAEVITFSPMARR